MVIKLNGKMLEQTNLKHYCSLDRRTLSLQIIENAARTSSSYETASSNVGEIDSGSAQTVWGDEGNIEAVVHPDGRSIYPRYNRCGILTSIECSDGSRIIKTDGKFPWVMVDPQGRRLEEIEIVSLSLDREGNLRYVTADGQGVTLGVDGSIKTEQIPSAMTA